MSYARWGDSDVYVYPSIDGPIVCCCDEFFRTSVVDELESHLRKHEHAGDVLDLEGIMAQARADFPSGRTP